MAKKAPATTAPKNQNKTQATGASVEDHLATRASPAQRPDCGRLIALLTRLTGQPAHMWGPSIVGFGAYRYTYESGRVGEAPLAAFAVRGRELVLYLDCESAPQRDLLTQLGKHRMGKSCLYFKQLADLDPAILEQLITTSIAETRRRHGTPF